MAAATDFSTVTFGKQVSEPARTIFGVLALFDNDHRGQFFLQDGTPIGPPHASLSGALAYAAKKGWNIEPLDADKQAAAEVAAEAPQAAGAVPPGAIPVGERRKAPRARGRGKK